MPKNDDDKFEFIPVDEDIAEWRKGPEFARQADARYAELLREIEADKARRAGTCCIPISGSEELLGGACCHGELSLCCGLFQCLA
ncbi:MAG: hypothetical protein MJE68_09750, partial [Proteobacteria bacterium]|nr:hypothetical protein [Pseudomonadota bacterium]